MTAPLPACPFCGADGEALRVLPPTCTPTSPYNPADRAYPVLRCGGCGASVHGEDWDALGASAIAAWNRRAAPAWRAESAPTDVRAWDMPPRVQVSFATMGEALDAVPIIRAAFAPPGATPAAPPADPDDLCSYCGAPAPGDEHWRYCPQTRPAAPPAREAALVEALVPFARMAGRMLACRQIVRAVPDTLPDDLGGEIITLVDDPAIGGDDRRSVTLRREHFMAARDAIPERWR